MKRFLSFLLFLMIVLPAYAEQHAVERGETALQIAIEHNLTMEQLGRLNPDVDLEMMLVGDVLIIPDEGMSFEEFLEHQYGELIRITDLNCEVLGDQSVLCLCHAENLSELPLFDVQLKAEVRGANQARAQAADVIPMIQILPGEILPIDLSIPGTFDEIAEASVKVENLTCSEMLNSSFRIPAEMYSQTDSFLPDGVAVISTIRFNEADESMWQDKHINVLAAAYDAAGELLGVRSLYSDFYSRLDITVYSNNRRIDHVDIRMEAY